MACAAPYRWRCRQEWGQYRYGTVQESRSQPREAHTYYRYLQSQRTYVRVRADWLTLRRARYDATSLHFFPPPAKELMEDARRLIWQSWSGSFTVPHVSRTDPRSNSLSIYKKHWRRVARCEGFWTCEIMMRVINIYIKYVYSESPVRALHRVVLVLVVFFFLFKYYVCYAIFSCKGCLSWFPRHLSYTSYLLKMKCVEFGTFPTQNMHWKWNA